MAPNIGLYSSIILFHSFLQLLTVNEQISEGMYKDITVQIFKQFRLLFYPFGRRMVFNNISFRREIV